MRTFTESVSSAGLSVPLSPETNASIKDNERVGPHIAVKLFIAKARPFRQRFGAESRERGICYTVNFV
jgi:hypothetical protein